MVLIRQSGRANKKKSSEGRYLVPAVDQASRVLFCLAGAGASHRSLIEICAQVGIHKSKAFSILETLQRFGLVQRNTDGKGYSLGPGLVSLSRKVLDDLSSMWKLLTTTPISHPSSFPLVSSNPGYG